MLTLSVPLSKFILYLYCYLLFFDLPRRTGTAEEQKKMWDTSQFNHKTNLKSLRLRHLLTFGYLWLLGLNGPDWA